MKAKAEDYGAGGREGPDPSHLCIDVDGPPTSPWNLQVSKIMLSQIKELEHVKGFLPCDRYMLHIIKDRIGTLVRAKKRHGVLYSPGGERETAEQQEDRIVGDKEKKSKRARQTSRRRRVSVNILVHLII